MDSALGIRALTPEQRMQQRIAALEGRVRDLERASATMPVNAGAPSSGEGRDGSLAVDQSNTRLWVKISGTWRYVTLM